MVGIEAMAVQAGMGPNAFASLSACRARLNMSNGIAGIERGDPGKPRRRWRQAAQTIPGRPQS